MKDVLDVVRRYLGSSRLQVPHPRAAWRVDDGRLVVELEGERLGENIQRLGPAVPTYALALSYWFERATGQALPAVVDVVGAIPTTLDGNRGRFMLTELGRAAGERLTVRGMTPWELPEAPVMNAPLQSREGSHDRGGAEHKAEVLLTQVETPLGPLQRQFPLGLFNGNKSKATRVFPGTGAQADLWRYDADTRTLHLAELKVGGNATVGIVPEALTYARLLQQFIAHPGARWSDEWDGALAARAAERIVVWLLCEEFHPLVFNERGSPLAWLNAGPLRDVLEFRAQRTTVDAESRNVEWGDIWLG